jgi:hypothetical protein
VGSMDRPVWWDEETTVAAMHYMECTLPAISLKYMVKQYLYKIRKIAYMKIFTCIIKMMYSIHSS